MRTVFQNDLKAVTEDVIQMARDVDQMLKDVVEALQSKNMDLAKDIIKRDDYIDEFELTIEEKCVNITATQCPIASDLRLINSVLKIISDLERIADHCVNIAKVVIANNGRDFVKPLVDLPNMQSICSEMIAKAIEAFIEQDVQKSREIIKKDDEVDAIYERIYVELLGMLSEDSELKDQVVMLLLIGRYLERIADHTTNVAERTIYIVTGKLK